MPRPRTPSRISDSLHQRLNSYALAASAAGVGLLALATPAEGKIVYTKAHRTIGLNTTNILDLNHDGTGDIILQDRFSSYGGSAYGRLSVVPAGKKNQVWGHTAYGRAFGSALLAGFRVGPKGQFLPGAGVMAWTGFSGGLGQGHPAYSVCYGPWANVAGRYLGLKFFIEGKPHFGWARLNVKCSSETAMVTGLLTGYAYETVSNRSIVTGRKKGTDNGNGGQRGRTPQRATARPGSLGRLAQGASGLAAGRMH
jgi:hypothetical protein